MTDDDQRNTLIVELHAQTGVSVTQLQAMSNLDLVLLGLGRRDAYVRGVLQVGGFRRYRELNGMSHDDHRNTLITELVGRTNQRVEHFQSLDDEALAGAGAVLVFLRQAGIRDDATLRTMSDDDQRNTLIATMAGHQGRRRAWTWRSSVAVLEQPDARWRGTYLEPLASALSRWLL